MSIFFPRSRKRPAPVRSLIRGSFVALQQLEDRSVPALFTGSAASLSGAANNGCIASGDLNEDGFMDYVVTNYGNSKSSSTGADAGASIGILYGSAAGVSKVETTYATGHTDDYVSFVAIGDLNGDGHLDIVSVESQSTSNTSNGWVTVFLNSGVGTFPAAKTTQFSSAGQNATWVGIADFTGDNVPDIAVTNLGEQDGTTITGNNLSIFQQNATSGKGNGSFFLLGSSTISSSFEYIPTAGTIFDVDGDGDMDVVTVVPSAPPDGSTTQNPGKIVVFNNSGTGAMTANGTMPSSGGLMPLSIVAADMTGDGVKDLVIANAGDPDNANSYLNFGAGTNVSVISGDGFGGFGKTVTMTSGLNGAFAVAVADLDLDGDNDIAVADIGKPGFLGIINTKAGALVVYRNTGTGTYTVDANSPYTDTEDGNQYLSIADNDNNGTPDIVVVGLHNKVESYTNSTRPTATTLGSSSTNAPAGTNITLTATVAVTGGYTDIPAGTVNFFDGTTNIGSGTLALVGSVYQATFSTTTLSVGARNITAKYTGQYASSPFTGVSTSAVVVTITGAANTAPTITPIGNQTVTATNSTGNISFTIGDAETAVGSLTVTATSGTTSVIPSANITLGGSGANRTISVLSTATIGSSLITVTVTDGGSLQAVSTFTVTVNAAGNTPPTIGTIANKTVVAGASTGNLAFTVGDAETAAGSLTLSASSDNPIIPSGAVTFGGSGANRTVSVQSTAATSGVANIIVTVSDGSLTSTSTFAVTVNANTNPTIGTIANKTVVAGASTGSLAFTVGDAETAVGSLTLSGSSNNTGVIPNGNITFGGSGANRTVSVLSTGTTGIATITVTVNDSNGGSNTSQFTVTVTPPNTNPSITDIPNQTVVPGGSVGPIAFLIGDNETAAGSLTLSVISSNPALIPASAVSFGTIIDGQRTVTVDTISGFAGTTTLTVTVSDGNGGTAMDQFTVTQNSAPIISDISNQSLVAGTDTGALAFTINDGETAASSLTVTRTSSNTAVIPLANVVLGGSNNNSRNVTVTAPSGVAGTSTITVTVSDGITTTSDTFDVTVTAPANTPPTISDIGNQSIAAGANTGALAFTIGDAETAAASLTVTRTSSNTAVIPLANVVLGGSGTARTVTVTAPNGVSGVSTITVTVSDGVNSTSDTFDVIVTAVTNTVPTISAISNQAIFINSATAAITFTVGDSETTAAALTLSAGSSNTTLIPTSKIVFGGSGANRTVTITPQTGQTGSSTITVTVTDGGGLTATSTFTLTVNPAASGRAREFSIGSDVGGGIVRFFNQDHTERFSLRPFGVDFTGGIRTAAADFTGDGIADLVAASGPGMPGTVIVFDGVTGKSLNLPQTVAGGGLPFGNTFTKGIIVAAGDLNNDGLNDLIITAEAGGGARVRIFQSTGTGFTQRSDFIALIGGDNKPDSVKFRGGSRATVSDINGDGTGDLIWAAGAGGGPRVATFDGTKLDGGSNVFYKLTGDFFVLSTNLRDGAYISGGDVNGDGIGDVIAGGGSGAPPQVVGFSGTSLMQNNFSPFVNFQFGANTGQGIRVAVKDVNGDGNADVLAGSAPGAGSRVAAFSGKNLSGSSTGTAIFDFDAYPGFTGGVFVG